MKQIFTFLIILIGINVNGQNNDINFKLYETYEKYKEPSLDSRRIKQNDIQPLIERLKIDSKYIVQKVGKSIEGRDLSLISIGTGKINVFLWSQMHGDEPTATQAIFDIFNFLDSADFSDEKDAILGNLTLHFLPMLNPDGAEQFTRSTALGIDMNRDALRLQSPESQILKRLRDSLNADFGFNLHDQSIYYNAERTDKTATISYLAPAYNYEKDLNDVRANAMKVIVFMNNIVQKYAPGQVGRYNDDFEPRAFGDNIQKWGTSTILIESGGFQNDVEKQEIRKLNYVSILSAIYTIANGDYKNIPIEGYEKIPENDRKLFDLKLFGATFKLLNNEYIIDLGINRLEIDNANHTNFYNIGRIIDQGDLSTYYGYETFDATGYTIVEGKVFPKILKSVKDLSTLNVYELLQNGYTYLIMKELPSGKKEVSVPIHLIGTNYKVGKLVLGEGANPTFLLRKNGKIEYAVINGFLIDLNTKKSNFKNALIYKR
ncbi:MAG: peptidase M14 [Flavobacteriales bacterium CG_4_10_14_0_2_um_filter_35_18]|nr:peptidase M14 [Bacteroidota bacterium]NCT16801.1 peptidase M14 [Flavobacteriia bacterium]PJA05500.1 MAG: peptidase M14 [Flavobacteriales bacterium CG_4_10_14_0_2_um_filter_35_18]